MAMRKLAIAILAAVGALVAVSVLLTLVSIVVGLVYALVVSVATIALFVLAAIGLYRVIGWSRGGSADDREPTRTASETTDPLERVQERYVEGELTEAEYERELERLMDDSPDRDRDLEDSFSGRY